MVSIMMITGMLLAIVVTCSIHEATKHSDILFYNKDDVIVLSRMLDNGYDECDVEVIAVNKEI